MADGPAKRAPDLTIRRAATADVPLITDLYRRISPDSFAARFLTPRATSSDLVARLAEFDPGHGDVVLVAAPADRPDLVVAEARYVPTGDGGAEFAIVVDDGVQGNGIGRRLLAELLGQAGQQGLDRLSAIVLLGNARMRRLLGRRHWVLVRSAEYGCLELEVSTRGGPPGWPPGDGRRVLVESASYVDSPAVARLRADGAVIRRCPGPRTVAGGEPGGACPLVTGGGCPLAEQADEIIHLFRGEGRDAILAEHRRRWPDRLRTADGPAAGATGPQPAGPED